MREQPDFENSVYQCVDHCKKCEVGGGATEHNICTILDGVCRLVCQHFNTERCGALDHECALDSIVPENCIEFVWNGNPSDHKVRSSS
jgi:hypothetical protein